LPRDIEVRGNDSWPDLVQNIWNGSAKLVFCIGLSFFVVPNLIGENDYVIAFLGSKPIIFLSRLTFTGYLVHFMII